MKSLVRLLALAIFLLASAAAAAPSTTTIITTTTTLTSTINYVLPSATPTSPAASPPTTKQPSNSICPGPLIVNAKNLTIPSCLGSCCIKCPMIDSFYEPNQVQNVLTAAYITRQVSLGLSVFMAISYMVLPGKRSQPHISVLFLTVSMSLWYAAFNVMPGVSNACANDFEYSTSSNSRLCGIQGVLIIYLTQTCALWCSLLIYKLHMLAVWRSNWIDAYYGWFTGLCWILPLGFAIPVAVKGLSEYPGIGFSCLVSKSNLNTYLFYPTAVYMYPAMLCHIVTVAKMIRLAMLSSRIDTGLSQLSSDARMRITSTMQAKRLLRGQWRPALMLATVMASLTIFWLFYFVDAHRLAEIGPQSVWLKEWLICVTTNSMQGKSPDETQRICAKGAAPNLPSIPWFTAAEMLVAIIGIVIALVFISKSEFWEEWAYLLTNLVKRGKTGSGSSSRGRSSPHDDDDRDDMPKTFHGANHPSLDDRKVNTGTPGLYRSNSKASYHEEPLAAQWYSMDDLVDKEYDGQSNRISHGSRAGMAANLGPNPMSDPPHYHNGEATPTHWAQAAHTIASPSRAYMGSSDHDRYIDQPVVPSPVPRTPKMTNGGHYLSDPSNTPGSIPVTPSSPTGYIGGGRGGASLSPMPPRSPPTSAQRTRNMDSVPVIGVATRVNSSQAQPYSPTTPTGSAPPSPGLTLSKKQRAALFNSNESGDQIMMASRESFSMSQSQMAKANPHLQQQMKINVALANSSMDQQRIRSPMPPSVPAKSPRRHYQQISPTS